VRLSRHLMSPLTTPAPSVHRRHCIEPGSPPLAGSRRDKTTASQMKLTPADEVGIATQWLTHPSWLKGWTRVPPRGCLLVGPQPTTTRSHGVASRADSRWDMNFKGSGKASTRAALAGCPDECTCCREPKSLPYKRLAQEKDG
jgi:hypothetical protein